MEKLEIRCENCDNLIQINKLTKNFIICEKCGDEIQILIDETGIKLISSKIKNAFVKKLEKESDVLMKRLISGEESFLKKKFKETLELLRNLKAHKNLNKNLEKLGYWKYLGKYPRTSFKVMERAEKIIEGTIEAILNIKEKWDPLKMLGIPETITFFQKHYDFDDFRYAIYAIICIFHRMMQDIFKEIYRLLTKAFLEREDINTLRARFDRWFKDARLIGDRLSELVSEQGFTVRDKSLWYTRGELS